MIHNQDRSGWFGASDTAYIMGSWQTETFKKWWLQKLGVNRDHLTTVAMQTGTALEHRILSHIGITHVDRQIRNRKQKLRVNLDGEDRNTVYEVKTHRRPFKVTKAYWMQAQVEMYAAKKPVVIVSYQLEQEDYTNWFRPIEDERLQYHEIAYDTEWIENVYLPRLRELAAVLRRGGIPW